MKAELIDKMGDDLRVVNAARVSFNKESGWEWLREIDQDGNQLKALSEKDTKLINYLAKHNHWTPFAHCMITMRETVPIFVARQRFKHMVGFTYNEVSRRYVEDAPEFYTPAEWRARAENKKQGSSDAVVDFELPLWVGPVLWGEEGERYYTNYLEACVHTYKEMLARGICPEQARMVLPQSMYTSYYVTGSLAAWARAYKQRIDENAQKEIRDLAEQWDTIIRPLFPVSWDALISG